MEQMWPRLKRRSERRGQVLILAAVGLVVMMVLAALVLDIGYILCTKTDLQNAADASSVAAALELAEQRGEGATESGARSSAETEGAEIAAANSDSARCEVLFGAFEDGEFAEQGIGTDAEAVQVKMYRDEDAPGGPLALFLAGLVGVDTVDVSTEAVCGLATDIRSVRNSGMAPFAVHEDDVVDPGQTMTIYDQDQQAPGNFGLLDLNGGSNPTGDLWDWILYGYPGEIEIDPAVGYLLVEGNPGWRSALSGAVEQRIGDTVIVCVHDQVQGQGANTTYRVVAFLAVTLTECSFTGQDKYIRGVVSEMFSVPFAETGGSASNNLCKIQLVK